MINIAGIHIQAGLDESIIRNHLSGCGSPVLDNLTQPSTHVVVKSIHNNKAGNISAKPDTYSSPKESMMYHIQVTTPIVINPKTISAIFKALFDFFFGDLVPQSVQNFARPEFSVSHSEQFQVSVAIFLANSPRISGSFELSLIPVPYFGMGVGVSAILVAHSDLASSQALIWSSSVGNLAIAVAVI